MSKRLRIAEIEGIRRIIEKGEQQPLYKQRARVEFPLGELVGSLAGFAWAWKMKGEMPDIQPIKKSDTFDAQGLEGKCVKETDLVTAVIIYAQCRMNRCQIFV